MDAKEKFNSINFAGEKLTKKSILKKKDSELISFKDIQNMKF